MFYHVPQTITPSQERWVCTWEGHLSPQPKGVTFQALVRVCALASACRGSGKKTPGQARRGVGAGAGRDKGGIAAENR